MTLNEIATMFSRLNDDEQFLLLDFLAERTEHCDEIAEGVATAVMAHYDGDEYRAAELIPHGCCDEKVWMDHAKKRDAILEGALRRRALEIA